jgi:type IV pilus assembly protein PilQ
MELGVDLNFMAGFSLDGTEATDDLVSGGTIDRGTSASSPIGDIDAAPGTPIETFGFAAAGGTGLRVGISCGDMRVFISALETVTDTTILANPKVLAVNKQEGTVLIGRNLGYRQTSSISSAGTEVEGEVLFLPTGTQLVFRPYIGNDGYIRMDIYPKDSTAELDADGVPQETTAELRTNVMVKDGETIVLGGLFRDVTVAGRQQVPLLGDIPIIGSVFRSTIDRTQREEVIILLTPHIIDAADQTEAAAREADINRKRYGARRTIQGISRARLAEDHYTNAVKLYTDGNSREALSELDNALDLRPTYLEAIKLKERIIGEVTPDEVGQIERIMIGVIEREDTTLWHRW